MWQHLLRPSQHFVLIKQSDSSSLLQFRVIYDYMNINMCKVAIRTESDLTAKRSTSRNKKTITDLIIIAGITSHIYYLRANTFHEFISLICRLPLSIFLIVLSLLTLRRTKAINKILIKWLLHSFYQESSQAHLICINKRKHTLFQLYNPHLWIIRFQGRWTVRKAKITLSEARAGVIELTNVTLTSIASLKNINLIFTYSIASRSSFARCLPIS